jgi:tRNA nucleotidyltransferase (CCA-adding enzyme)
VSPRDPKEAAERLARATIAPEILELVERLQNAGHETVLVGGAVRDVLRNEPTGDWDVATAAPPDAVQALFRRSVPTGVRHGTVTVLQGDKRPWTSVEVTTFRGEGTYEDGRHPSEVRFIPSLEQDLARRDFTINAFAWDPIARDFTDPFDGLKDLEARLIRAVGDPEARFSEDGLRTMRAVRFCATLGFSLDPATESAIPKALPILAKVSRERVSIELFKLLEAAKPSLGLEPMARTGMWPHVLAETEASELEAAIQAVDRMQPDPVLRLCRLLWPLRAQEQRASLTQALDNLKPSRETRARVLALTDPAWEELASASAPAQIRRAAAHAGPEHLEEHCQAVTQSCANAPLSVSDLAISGTDLLAARIIPAGPDMGRILNGLLDHVLEDPRRNERAQLLELARELAKQE